MSSSWYSSVPPQPHSQPSVPPYPPSPQQRYAPTPPHSPRYGQYSQRPHPPPPDPIRTYAGGPSIYTYDTTPHPPPSYERPPSPQYVGRRKRAASAARNLRVDTAGRNKFPPGYKPPSVESVPTSPIGQPTLSSESGSIFEENPDYIRPEPAEEPNARRPVQTQRTWSERRKEKRAESPPPETPIILERDRRRYAGSSGVADSVSRDSMSQPPPETSARQPRPYATSSSASASPLMSPRQPRPYGYGSTCSSDTGERASSRRPVRYPKPDPEFTRESVGVRQEAPALQSSRAPKASNGSLKSHPASHASSPRSSPEKQSASLVRRPATPDEDVLDLVPACPQKKLVSRGHWFEMPDTPGFNVCEKCYETHIYPTAFRNRFIDFSLNPGQQAFCAFNTPRILKIVWPKAINHNRFDLFVSYATTRSKIPTCSLAAGTKRGIWYTMDDGTGHTGFIACQACYEDVILASPYHTFFKPLEATVGENVYSCHVGTPFIEAQLVSGLDYMDFKREVEYRLRDVPPCPGPGVVTGEVNRRWWTPKGVNVPLRICDSCYCDGVFPSPFVGKFSAVFQGPNDPWFCSMGAFQLNIVWQCAVEKHDYETWLDAAVASYKPMCTAEGTRGGSWNVFRDENLKDFEICDRCADVYVRPLGFSGELKQKNVPREYRVVCGLNSHNNPRQPKLLEKLGEAALWRDFEIFAEYLAPRIGVQPCPGIRAVSNEKWWGFSNFNACQECYTLYMRNSPLVGYLEYKGRESARETVCDMASDDVKMLWERASSKGVDWFLEVLQMRLDLVSMRSTRERLATVLDSGRYGGGPQRGLQIQLAEAEKKEAALAQRLQRVTIG